MLDGYQSLNEDMCPFSQFIEVGSMHIESILLQLTSFQSNTKAWTYFKNPSSKAKPNIEVYQVGIGLPQLC